MTQIEQWSILSNVLNYIQYEEHSKNYHNLSINAVNKYRNSLDTGEERDIVELDFGVMLKILREEYLDVNEGIQSEVMNTTRCDENLDLSTTYLGRSDRAESDKLKAEVISHIRTGIYIRQIIRWNRMSTTVRYRGKQVVLVTIILYAM